MLFPYELGSDDAIVASLETLKKGIEGDAAIRDCLLYVPVKKHLRGSTLAARLGQPYADELHNGNALEVGAGRLRAITDAAFKSYTKADAMVVIYADQKMMDKVDANQSLKLVICAPHGPGAVDGWISSWDPVTPGKGHQRGGGLENSVVEAALEAMTRRINLSNSVLGAADKLHVKETFRILRAHEQVDDAARIRAWCVGHGWHPSAADEAKALAQRIFGLAGKPSLAAMAHADAQYEKWVKEASH
jgi:hypothetical protein